MSQQQTILEIKNLYKAFRGNHVIEGLDMVVEQGPITTLVGPNGAGKTTIFNLITGFLFPDSGKILYKGREIQGTAPFQMAPLGIARSFQNVRLFRNMTVYENVLAALEKGLRDWRNKQIRERVEEVLDRLDLLDKGKVLASELSYAETKFLSLARLIALPVDLLLLDEPASGLDGPSLNKFEVLLRSLQKEGRSILLIEHNLDTVRGVSDRLAFLDRGKLLAYGIPEEIMKDKELTEIYFGGGKAHA